MSMLSVQCDELRKAARGQKAMGLFDLAQMLNDAADTITELRGKLQVASVDYRHLKDDNAKLRELVDYMTPIALYAASELERDRMRELGVEVD